MYTDDGYAAGMAEGYQQGLSEGYADGYQAAERDYQDRLAKYWAELQTLNARIDYLEKKLNEQSH